MFGPELGVAARARQHAPKMGTEKHPRREQNTRPLDEMTRCEHALEHAAGDPRAPATPPSQSIESKKGRHGACASVDWVLASGITHPKGQEDDEKRKQNDSGKHTEVERQRAPMAGSGSFTSANSSLVPNLGSGGGPSSG